VNHLGDTNKMVGETPRTDEAQFGTGRVSVSFARTLERELNAANAEIEEKRKDVVWLATEKAKLENRIKRLEEAGNNLLWNFCPEYTSDLTQEQSDALKQWNKAKEAKP
jgi:hypothetical protein